MVPCSTSVQAEQVLYRQDAAKLTMTQTKIVSTEGLHRTAKVTAVHATNTSRSFNGIAKRGLVDALNS